MNKTFDNAFILGVIFNFSLFVILNAADLLANERKYESSGIQFAPAGFRWGFPFNWGESYGAILEGGTILNFGMLLLGGVFFGVLFKYIWSIVAPREAESV